LNKEYDKLIEEAKKAREKAYTPYSKFKVGAAVLTSEGKIFSGCNIENASFSLSTCAERVAIFKAISEGANKLKAVAIIADTKRPCTPCGACRQVISEFGENIVLIMANLKGDIKISKIDKLLPNAFNRDDLIL
jgi:cytidine deaminase